MPIKNSSAGKNGGGLIGGAAVKLLHPLLGTVGCYVVVIVLILITVVLITQKSIFIPLGKRAAKPTQRLRSGIKSRKELRKRKKKKLRGKLKKEERGSGGNRNITFDEVKEEFEKKDFNFDLTTASEAPEKVKLQKKQKPDKRRTKKNKAVKPSVEDITEEIILPWQGEDRIQVSHMDPIEPVTPEKDRKEKFLYCAGGRLAADRHRYR